MVLLSTSKVNYTASWETENTQFKPTSKKDRIVRCVLFFMLRSFIYPGSSFKKYIFTNFSRKNLALKQLKQAGGEKLKLQTPDGDTLSATMLTATRFRDMMSHYFELKEEGDETYWTLKAEHYVVKGNDKKPSPEGFNQIKMLAEKWHIPLTTKVSQIEDNLTLREPRFSIGMQNFDRERNAVIISHANAMGSEPYKAMAFFYLMRGVDVLLVDQRGYGKSSGGPSDQKCKLDLDTAFQYLRDVEKIPESHMMVQGHCLGSVAAVDLAARRQNIHLILDRPVADIKERMIKYLPAARSITEWLHINYLNYNNLENLPKVKGHILCLYSTSDETVPFDEIRELVDALPNHPKQLQRLVPIQEVGHVKSWTRDAVATVEMEIFLKKIIQGRDYESSNTN